MYNLKILTPVHIGVSSEKNLSNGLEFISTKNTIYILDAKKLIDKIPTYEIANAALKKNGVQNLLKGKHIKNEDVSSHIIKVDRLNGWEIRAQIKNGFGKPYLPGSSLKGAIRSMLVHHFMMNSHSNNLSEDIAFGHIENSILRFLQIPDAHFSKIGIYNTAIMSLIKNSPGNNQHFEGWKKDRKTNVPKFIPNGMATIYESLLPGDQSNVDIMFKADIYREFDRRDVPNNFQDLFSGQFQQRFLPWIKKYSRAHIDREKKFVEQYFNQSKRKVLKVLNWLSELNDKDDAAVLRVGAGVGYHSITGDWKYIDHTQTGVYSKKDHNKGKKRYKTRKFAFSYSNDDYHLWPLGFILLSKNDVSVQYSDYLINELSKIATKPSSVLKEPSPTEPPKPIQPLENKKFKLGEKVMAVGTGRKKGLNNAVVILYINGYESKEFDFRYAAGFGKGQLIEVEIKGVNKKGVINTISFSKTTDKNILN